MAHQKSPPARAPSRDIQAAMDRVLTTHGAYVPVELLLTLGWLRYPDYEAWRSGELPNLHAALEVNPRHTVALLEAAAGWAKVLGLQPERQAYFGWGACACQQLTFFDGRWVEAEAMLATHHVRPTVPADGGQLDIFLDSAVTAALQDLREALRARDPMAADRALAALAANAPEHSLRPAAERVTDALADLPTPLSPEGAEAELETLEQTLLPAARDVLGPHARDLLAPFWQRLAAALTDAPFDPKRPALHASYAYTHCLDWRRAAAAVEAVPDYAAQPALLARLAKAHWRDDDRSGAIAACCMLCWRSAGAAEKILDDPALPDTKLRDAWIEFHDLDLDPPPEAGLFPARLLLAEPGLARALAPDLAAGNGAGEHAFRAVRQLLHQDGIDTRKAVHDAAPWLLEAYLNLRVTA